jgi:presenilin-like A22 family membrane protease
MNKFLITLGMAVGSTIGALSPQMWGDRDFLSFTVIVLGLVGGIVGIWAGVKLSKLLS